MDLRPVSKKYQILVCKGPECGDKRHSIDIFQEFKTELPRCPLDGNEVVVDQYSCFGRCQRGPNVLVREVKPGENARMILLMPTAAAGAYLYHAVKPSEVRLILDEHCRSGRPLLDFTRRK
jgi:(2Fe-2S) ferredoxin